MLVKTRDFGDVEIAEEDVITLAGPIFGFEEYQKFILLRQKDEELHFVWLQSVDEQMVCFVMADPCMIAENYQVTLKEEEAEKLGEGKLLYFAFTVIRDPYYESTVNLKSPLVINPTTGRAMQVILDEDYPIRQLLVSRKEDA